MDIAPGTVVANRYRISRPLGRGGMGEVFAAENIRTGRGVAVKLLHAESKDKASAVTRFRREARAAGSINSDHVTQVLDVEEDSEHGIVLVFELLEGESLIERLKRTGPMPFAEVHTVIDQVWLGLADAHRAGIIHRDLKPSNVFLEHRPDGSTRVKILDFGISKLPKEMGGETLTEMGQSLGTFSFMPPEQIGKAKTVDHRADIYACATMIYQALSGQLPYAARNILVMVDMKAKSDARSLEAAMGSAVDPRLEAFLQIGLSRDPERRFQTALEALGAWRDLGHQPDVPASPSGRAADASQAGVAAPSSPPSSGANGGGRVEAARQSYPRGELPPALRGAHDARRDGAGAAPPLAHHALPAIGDATTDSGATLAMRGAATFRPPEAHAVSQPMMPPALRGGTVRVPALQLQVAEATASASFEEKSRLGPGPPYYPGAPAPAQAPQRAPYERIAEEPGSASPVSAERTRVYHSRESGNSVPNPAMGLFAPPTALGPAVAREAARSPRTMPFVFGAIGFAVAGFLIVALILLFLRR